MHLRREMFARRVTHCSLLFLLAVLLRLDRGVSAQLIRPFGIYTNIIRQIHDYFNNTCIVLMHATPAQRLDLRHAGSLLDLQKYLSLTFRIRTAIMDIGTFKERIGEKYYHIKRPLFVLLNDRDDLKDEFTNVSTWIRMSYPTWLIFFGNETRIDDYFGGIYIPFDCTFLISRANGSTEVLTEVYQIDRKQELRSMVFGTWNVSKGLKGPMKSMWERRNNLHGHLLRVTTINDPPLTYLQYNEKKELAKVGGPFGNLLMLLEQNMNCTLVYTEADGWAEIISMLKNNEADIAGNELMVTAERMDNIAFTTPIITTKCRAYIKTPKSTVVKWAAYFAPFHSSIWHFLGLLIVVASATISAMKAAMRIVVSYIKDSPNASSKFSEIMLIIFGAFCNQGMPQSLLDPVRLVHLVIHMTAVIVLAAYSAALISFLAVKSVVMPFTTMDGLLEDGTYRFGTVSSSADYTFFQTSTDETLQLLYNTLLVKEAELPANYLEGLQRVCSSEKYAFVTTENTAALLQRSLSCTLEPLDTIKQTSTALAVNPGSPYLGIINYNILLVRDSGVLHRLLHSSWIYDTKRAARDWTPVDFNDIVPLLVIIYSGIFVSFMLLGAERLVYQKFLHRRQLRNNMKKRKVLVEKKKTERFDAKSIFY